MTRRFYVSQNPSWWIDASAINETGRKKNEPSKTRDLIFSKVILRISADAVLLPCIGLERASYLSAMKLSLVEPSAGARQPFSFFFLTDGYGILGRISIQFLLLLRTTWKPVRSASEGQCRPIRAVDRRPTVATQPTANQSGPSAS